MGYNKPHKKLKFLLASVYNNPISLNEFYFKGTYMNIENKNQIHLLEQAEKIARVGHWQVNLEKQELYWSKEIYRIHGVKPETYKPCLKSAVNFYSEDDRPRIEKILQRSLKTGEDFTFEAKVMRPSGEIRHVRSSGECATNNNGEISGLFGVFVDITEEAKSKAELKDNYDFLNLIMENIPDFLFVKDKDFKIIRANHAFISAYPKHMQNRIIGHTTVEKFNKVEADAFLLQDKIAFKNGFSETEEHLTLPNGHKSTLFTKKVRFEDSNRNQFILGLARDISQIKKTETELKNLNSELEEFAYRTSHDLRSPLLSSIGLLNIVKEYLEEGNIEEVQLSIDAIISSLEGLERLVQDILDLTRTRMIDEDVTDIHFSEIIHHSIQKFKGMENFDNIDFQVNVDKSIQLMSLKSRVSIVIENLISNSIKYVDTTKDQAFTAISVFEKENFVYIEVVDNGLGIPKEKQAKLFTMFQRFHPKVAFGSGLGLYIMQKSVEVMGGEIKFEDTGSGSKFIVKLPYK